MLNTCFKKQSTFKGFTLVEVVVASALLLLIFSGLMSGVQLMMELIGNSKAESGARSLAVSKMEFIRSLDYDTVGTIAGIPSGPIPQTSTTKLNGITYTERVLIQYLDREEDGFGESDQNGITEDSKRIKIEYTWNVRGRDDSLVLISDIVPKGIESTSGGGTLFINVFDASVQPVVGASVHVYNDSVATDTIDVLVTTNASGIANFPGAPARGGYQVTVTKPGYSTDQTYSASSTNPNPTPPHVAVSEGVVSSVYFSIDELSDLTIEALGSPVRGVFSDSFSSSAQLATTSDMTVSGGVLLLNNSGGYASEGYAYSVATSPGLLDYWETLTLTGTSSTESSYVVQVYQVETVGTSSVYTLLPDEQLLNNSIGFTKGPIDLTTIDASVYDTLALGVEMTSTDSSKSASLYEWGITYVEDKNPASGVTFDITSNKSIGTNAGTPVPKYQTSVTTNSNGEAVLTELEWDSYDITFDDVSEGYTLVQTSEPIPYALAPNASDTVVFELDSYTPYSLLVTVKDTDGAVIPGAEVGVSNGAYDETKTTTIYGQSYFDGMASSTDYNLVVSADGYDADSQTNISITGSTNIAVVLAEEGSVIFEEEATSTPSTYLEGFTYRAPLSIAGASLYGNVVDFPVYVDLADMPSTFFSSVQTDGSDVRVTAEDGLSEVPFELVSIDTVSKTGELYFKANSLSISTDAEYYVYFGHATATLYASDDIYGRENVWSNNYRAVYHLEEEQSGTGNANIYVDSTANNYDGTDYISNTGKSGKFGAGQRFEANTNDYMSLPSGVLDGLQDLTTSVWFRSNNDTIHSLISGANSGEANEYLWWLRGDQNEVEIFSHGNPREQYNITDVYDDSWRLFTAVLDDDSNQARVYLNGNEDNQSPRSANVSTLDIDVGGVIIGQDQDFVGGGFDWGQELDGHIDELRVSSVVRSSGWIANEYANQSNPSGFYTIGSIETE